MGLCYHEKHLPEDMYRRLTIRLRKTFHYAPIFTDRLELADYLKRPLIVSKIVFIASGQLAKFVLGIAKKATQQCLGVYELSFGHEFDKLKAVDDLFDLILRDFNIPYLNQHDAVIDDDVEESTLSMSIFNAMPSEKSFRFLNKESLKFLCFQSCIKILFDMKHGRKALEDMSYYCRDHYEKDKTQIKNIDDFQSCYDPNNTIYYYTKDWFVHRVVNRAFRREKIECIFPFRGYITDLHQQIRKLARKIRILSPLHRGKILSTDVLQQLKDNIDRLISINGFLSTTEVSDVAEVFAGNAKSPDGFESVLFEMHIDQMSQTDTLYAKISECSAIRDEREVLFSPGFVWRIESVDNEEKDGKHYWKIKLRECNNIDKNWIDRFKAESPMVSLSNILRELGEYSSAKNFYPRILEEPNVPEKDCAFAYYNLGMMAEEHGELMDAILYLQKAYEKFPESSIDTVPTSSGLLHAETTLFSQLKILNNMGKVYEQTRQFDEARHYYQKALDAPGGPIEHARVYYNEGRLEFRLGHYRQAHKYLTTALGNVGDDNLLKNDIENTLKTVLQHLRR